MEALAVPLPPQLPLPGRLAPGCQYVKFSEAGDRLAASFDALFVSSAFLTPCSMLRVGPSRLIYDGGCANVCV